MPDLRPGTSVIMISFSPTDMGVVRAARVRPIDAATINVDGILLPAGQLSAWDNVEQASGGFVRHYIEGDALIRQKYALVAA